jgi:hypothetical protein
MKAKDFFEKIPNIKGFTIDDLRCSGDEVKGLVLKDESGKKRYILRFQGDIEVEDYW